MLDPEWVRKFCLGGQESVLHPLKAIAAANLVARQALYNEFCRQNKVAEMLNVGGDFQYIPDLPEFTSELATEVTKFFKRCYKLLSTDTQRQWNGFEFKGNRLITNRSYKDDFCSNYPTMVVCPYCDDAIGTPQLDHYLFKSGFPLLACSPWNLVPVCSSCNEVITAKGDRPAITPGPPPSTDNWLHPFFRPATPQVQITLSGSLPNSIPKLTSPDPTEQIHLDNHTDLIQTLEKRWTKNAAAYFDAIVGQIKRRISLHSHKRLAEIVQDRLDDHLESRGKMASSMIHAAVCRAILEQRPEYIEEFADSNPPRLEEPVCL